MVEFKANGMKYFVVFIVLVVACLYKETHADGLNEDDRFRRLLRRASVEADRPLIREQRRNKDEDDEDGFSDIMESHSSENDIIRKRRADEDEFYHTLLSRSEAKHKEKRSFDTNDVDNKAGYIVREDWTGDSKISDADREELENLFQKLNADEGPAKTDVARSTSDDESFVDGAANDYTAWLMKQPADKMGAALNHKAEVDHKLTQLFFKNKRASFPPPNCNEKSSHCKCRRTCHPYTVAKYSPCRCSTNNPARASISKTTHISDSVPKKQLTAIKRHKHFEEKPSNVRYPEPIHWVSSSKKSEAPNKNATVGKSNSTSENCTTAECLCDRTCHPKPVASSAPCECQEKPNEGKTAENTLGKTVLSPGSKLCTDDSPKCLCTRACYPKAILSYAPCNCEGDGAPPPKNATTPPSPPLELTNATNPNNYTSNTTAPKEDFIKAAAPVKKPSSENSLLVQVPQTKPAVPGIQAQPAQTPQAQTPQIQTPLILQTQPAALAPQQAASMNVQKAQLCSDTSQECICKKKCYPNFVNRVSPCSCHNPEKAKQIPVKPEQYNLQTSKSFQVCSDNTPECNCKNMCHPTPVAAVTPCYCQSPVVPDILTSSPDRSESSKQIVQTQPGSQTTTPIQSLAPQVQNNTSATNTTTTPSNNTVQAQTQNNLVPQSTTQGFVNAVTSQMLHPYTQTSSPNPTLAQVSIAQASLLRSPAIAQKSAQATFNKFEIASMKGEQRSVDPIARGWCTKACHPLTVAAENPCKCSSAGNAAGFFPPRSPENKLVSAPAASNVMAATSVNLLPAEQVTPMASIANVHVPASRPAAEAASIVTDISAQTDTGAQTRHAVAANGKQNATVPAKTAAAVMENIIKPADTKSKSYQGCYKDKKPIRDLPKRFNRFGTTPEACISECKYQNYKFAGVQYGYLCFCGNSFGRYGKALDSDCNSLCDGDSKRRCGAFWHNSVYAVDDSKEYDPSDFDFAKIDAAERLRDTLPAPAVKTVIHKQAPVPNNDYSNNQGANVATHLMKAAQAALKAAKKLLPSVSKKHKVHHKKGGKGRKEKREDDEEDAELMQEKMAAMASLGAAHEILQKTNFGLDKRDAEREKRSIDEDSDPYDPDNGKDLLAAYLANVDAYKRQVRSIDEDEEDEDPNEKPKFEYRRMVMGESDEGEFVEKYEDDKLEYKKKKRAVDGKKKRATLEGSGAGEKKKRTATEGSGAGEKKRKRSVSEGSGTGEKKRRSLVLGSGAGEKKRRSLAEGSGAGEKKRRSLVVGSGAGEKKRRSLAEGSDAGEKKRRSLAEGSGAGEKKRRSLVEGSGAGEKKRRSLAEGSGAGARKRRSLAEGSGAGARKRRSLAEGSGAGEKKRRSLVEGNGAGEKKRRSVVKGSGAGARKRRTVTEGSGSFHLRGVEHLRRRRSLSEGSGSLKTRRSIEGSADFQRRRRELPYEMVYGADNMVARSSSLKEIEAKLRLLEEKRDEIPEEALAADDENENDEDGMHGDNESGSGESDEQDTEEIAGESGSESGDSDDHDIERRNSEDDMESLFVNKRSTDEKADNSTAAGNTTENAHLKSDVEKGVDSLLNLVVELYKQQKTIKAFESSVRSLRHDILRELNVPQSKKNTATKKVREEIEKTARERLHVLTSSIEHKISEFAKSHPEASKQANLATSLLPKLPLSEEKFAEAKKEISRRAAEFDDPESAFDEGGQIEQNDLPDILKEHFRRNSEPDVEFVEQKREVVNGEQKLSRMHRDVQQSEMETADDDDEFEKLFH